jgi:hypothetical protein
MRWLWLAWMLLAIWFSAGLAFWLIERFANKHTVFGL